MSNRREEREKKVKEFCGYCSGSGWGIDGICGRCCGKGYTWEPEPTSVALHRVEQKLSKILKVIEVTK